MNAPRPLLYAPGVATPALVRLQQDVAAEQAERLGLSASARQFLSRVVAGSGIHQRAAVLPLADVLPMTTAERMRAFHLHAPALAERAARGALANAGISAQEITDLVIVTCTGFRSPGVGLAVAASMGMRDSVRHMQVGFMGCFGGVTGLRAAAGLACADPHARVLLVCVELCSLHFRPDADPQNLVAITLFADGAAAAVISCAQVPGEAMAAIGAGRSQVIPGTEEHMTWTVTDSGFAMTLAREVPEAVESAMRAFVRLGAAENAATDAGVNASANAAVNADVILHPGGAGIIDACVRAGVVHAGEPSAEIPRSVLRDHGNMSSGTVLFVLDRMQRAAAMHDGTAPCALRLPALVTAFGPGLTVDSVQLNDPAPTSPISASA